MPCSVDDLGLHPQAMGALPPQCAALNAAFLAVGELTVRAALEGDPRLVRQAAMVDPNASATPARRRHLGPVRRDDRGARRPAARGAAHLGAAVRAAAGTTPEGGRAAGAGGGDQSVSAQPWVDVVVMGELNPDVVVTGVPPMSFGQREDVTGPTTMTVGSSVAISACGLARLGTATAIVGVVGDDAFGDFMLSQLSSRGVDVSAVRTVAGRAHRLVSHPCAPRGRQRPSRAHRPGRHGATCGPRDLPAPQRWTGCAISTSARGSCTSAQWPTCPTCSPRRVDAASRRPSTRTTTPHRSGTLIWRAHCRT